MLPTGKPFNCQLPTAEPFNCHAAYWYDWYDCTPLVPCDVLTKDV